MCKVMRKPWMLAWVALCCGILVVSGCDSRMCTVTPRQDRLTTSGSVDSLVAKVRTAALCMQRKSWEQGVLGTAFVEAGDNDLIVQMAKASRIYTSKDGVVAALDGAPVDPLMAGEVVWKAAQLSGDPSLRKAADDMLNWAMKIAPRASDGTIYHTGRAMWSDSFHTSPPFLSMAGQYDEAVGSRRSTSRPQIGCAPPRGPRWTAMVSYRVWPQRRPSTGPASRQRARPSSS